MTKRQLQALIAVTLSSSVVFLDGTVVNLALPKLASSLHAGFTAQQWTVEGYLLTLSALILLGGTLGDIFGRKRVYLMGLLGFGLSSLVCAVAPTAGALVAARLLQGVFGALLIPGALAIIETNFRPEQRGGAFGRWTAWSSAATAVGPLLGGYLIDAVSWRAVFLINLPLVLLSFWLAVPSVHESRDDWPRRVDSWGAGLAMLALAGITYGLIQGPPQHWSAGPVAALVVGAALAVIFVVVERRAADPMLNLALFRSRNFTGANLTTFAMYGALSGFFFAYVIYAQTALGFSSLMAGLSTLPITLCLLLLSRRAGAWSDRYGPRLFMTIGPILAGLGMAALWWLHPGVPMWAPLPGIIVFGIGMALTVAPLTTTVMAAVDETSAGIASAVNNAVSRVAGLVIIALLGLFGAASSYRFSVALCAGLAIVAGIISWLLIKNPRIAHQR
jgi:EmrB/QacA subfamily drug resistance transporter